MREVSELFRRTVRAPQSDEVVVALVTIDHETLVEPIRLCSNPAVRISEEPEPLWGTISRGQQYLFLPFRVTFPVDHESQTPRARFVIDNIGRKLVPLVRQVVTPPSVLIELVLASSPDIIEVPLPDFRFLGVSYDAAVIEGEIGVDSLADEPYPGLRFIPSMFPGLFNRTY